MKLHIRPNKTVRKYIFETMQVVDITDINGSSWYFLNYHYRTLQNIGHICMGQIVPLRAFESIRSDIISSCWTGEEDIHTVIHQEWACAMLISSRLAAFWLVAKILLHVKLFFYRNPHQRILKMEDSDHRHQHYFILQRQNILFNPDKRSCDSARDKTYRRQRSSKIEEAPNPRYSSVPIIGCKQEQGVEDDRLFMEVNSFCISI